MWIWILAIVLVIALIVFGPKRLPDLGRSLGKGIREFRDGVSSIGSDHERHDELDGPEPEVTDTADSGAMTELQSGPVEVEVEEITAEPKTSDAASRD